MFGIKQSNLDGQIIERYFPYLSNYCLSTTYKFYFDRQRIWKRAIYYETMNSLFSFNYRILPDGISLAQLITSIPINRKDPIKFDFDYQAMISTMLTKNKSDRVEWKNYKKVRRRSSLGARAKDTIRLLACNPRSLCTISIRHGFVVAWPTKCSLEGSTGPDRRISTPKGNKTSHYFHLVAHNTPIVQVYFEEPISIEN